MNPFLFLPGLLLILVFHFGYVKTILSMLAVAALQFVFAIEFLLLDFWSYWPHAFRLGRCIYKNSKTYRWLEIYCNTSDWYQPIMTSLQLITLALFLLFKWTRFEHFFHDIRLVPFTSSSRKLDPKTSTMILVTCQFIMMVLNTGLHFSYMTWYLFSWPFLLNEIKVRKIWRIWIWIAMDVCWMINQSSKRFDDPMSMML